MQIYNDTIIQLVVRQGSDSDRRLTLLKSGEFGYTTDQKRLFVGSGVLSGGDVVGNLCKATAVNLNDPTIHPSIVGDTVFCSEDNSLYRLKINSGSSPTDWECIGKIYTSGDNYIVINSNNEITINPLSANSVSSDLVTGPIILDSGRISLSSKIPFTAVSTNTIAVSSGLKLSVGGVDVTGTSVNPLSSNVLIESNQMFINYEGLSGGAGFSRNILSNKLSAGDYMFTFGPLPTSNILPICQIYGSIPVNTHARVMATTNSSCNVHILSSGNTKTDANVFLSITY